MAECDGILCRSWVEAAHRGVACLRGCWRNLAVGVCAIFRLRLARARRTAAGGRTFGLSLLASLAVSMLPVVASMKHVVLCSPYFMSVEQSRKPKPHEGLDVTRQEHGMHPSGIAHEPPLPPLAQEGAFLCNITPPVVLTS